MTSIEFIKKLKVNAYIVTDESVRRFEESVNLVKNAVGENKKRVKNLQLDVGKVMADKKEGERLRNAKRKVQSMALLLQPYSKMISIKVVEAAAELIFKSIIESYNEFDALNNKEAIKFLTVEGIVQDNRKIGLLNKLDVIAERLGDMLKGFPKRIAKSRNIELLSRVLFPFNNYSLSDIPLGNLL
eukprot:TRINITY_DN14610_c0_g1_i2.p1 TRINITY_DN14610_c0_g1~~TRINITY_DN14610_c0_g1_i2.p1  ORF type:complete len:186 (+),score=46.61 TRINITY_DN14610_c0_g1_i2:217-774(+)